MRETCLAGEDDPLDGFEFLTMAEAGDVGHWAILAKPNERADVKELRELTRMGPANPGAPPAGVLDGSLNLAADEDPNEEDG